MKATKLLPLKLYIFETINTIVEREVESDITAVMSVLLTIHWQQTVHLSNLLHVATLC